MRFRAALAGVVGAVLAGGGQARRSAAAEDCGLELEVNAPPVPRKAREVRADWTVAPVRRVRAGEAGQGALAGKIVYLSAGHGWTWASGAWRTQRGNTNGLVEDLISAETIDQYLVEYLRRMGAHVVTVRESDLNPNAVIVDDGDVQLDAVVERPGADVGWGAVPLPITSDDTNPFTAGGARLLETAATARGEARYRATLPAAGHYHVYVSWAQGPDRASDAHYVVRHAGGESHFRVDQRRHGGTWVFFGRFWFDPAGPAEVAVVDDSADAAAGAVVSLDAVRWGGGVGVTDRGGGSSGRPRWEECARYNAQLYGAPRTVFDYAATDGNDDVGARSRFAAWDHAEGEDAVYLAWHTNAPNPGRGTESYTYGPSPPPGPLSEFSGVPGSRQLQDAVHAELVGDLRAVWDPAWPDRGRHTAYFGEVNPAHNPEMPAVLVEVAFHDTPSDADALRDPRFRRVAARALAQGVARYFAQRDGLPLTLPSEPPAALAVRNDGQGGLVVTWRPPTLDAAAGDPPTGYRVYVSRDGRGFDDGTPAAGTSFALPALGAGAVRYVRVTATNAGGESLPTEVVGARVAASGAAPVLVVGGFDRLDGALLPAEDLTARGLGLVDRMILAHVNDGSYAIRHGEAIAAAGAAFDGATDEAIESGDVPLAGYVAVDWFLGEESSGDEPLSAAARVTLAAFLAAGGRLFVSGAELGWAMDFGGDADERAFFRDVLRAAYVADDAETYDLAPLEGLYGGLGPLSFRDPDVYDPEWPDVLAPGAGAAAALAYQGGAGGHAAIVWTDGAQRGVLFGFPFETIAGAEARAAVMDRTLTFLEVPDEPEPDPTPDAGPGGGDDDLSGGCGCRAAGRGGAPGSAAAILLAFALLLDLRRRSS